MKSATHRIIHNTTYMYLKMGITLIINLYATRVTLIQLGENDYGLFGVVAGAVNMLGFLNATVMHTTQRFINYYMGMGDLSRLKRVFNNSFLIHVLIAIVVLLIMETAAYPLFEYVLRIDPHRMTTAQIVYQLMVITSVCTIITCPYDACINAHEHLLFYGLSLTVITFLLLFTKVLFCRIKYSECRLSLIRYFDRQQIRQQLVYASWNFFGVTGIVLGNYGSSLVLNHFFGTRINAAHSVSGQMKGHLLAMTNNLSKAVDPVITKKAGEGDIPGMLRYTLTSCKLYYLIFSLLALPFIVEAPFLLAAWLREVPQWTLPFLRWEIVITWMELLTLPFYTALFACGHVREINLFKGMAHLLPVIIVIILFRYHQVPTWLYILTFITVDILTPIYVLLLMRKYYQLDIPRYIKENLLPALLSTAVGLMAGWYLSRILDEGWIRLLLIGVTMDLIFILTMLRWGFTKQEHSLIRRIMSPVLMKLHLKRNN
ncbi:MAG: hypothetical protein IJK82_06155 [Prevotella sp.]|nr:hypothetical protein [Prevotella sp.]